MKVQRIFSIDTGKHLNPLLMTLITLKFEEYFNKLSSETTLLRKDDIA